MSFQEFLESLHISPAEYIKIARDTAKKKGYDPHKLSFSLNSNYKLTYDGVSFGANKYNDFIIYGFLVKQGVITKETRELRRASYLTRSAKIKGNWQADKNSKNNLARNILW
jgi:hypothetical protein